MSALEQEIIAKFRLLDKSAQQRVREIIAHEPESAVPQAFDFDAWQQQIEALRGDIRSSHGGTFPSIDAVNLLRDLRDGEDE